MEITLAQLAVQLHGDIVGGNADAIVSGVAGYDTVMDEQVTFVTDARKLDEAEQSPALAIITPRAIARPSGKPLLLVDDAVSAFTRALAIFDWRRPPMPGIHPSAVLAQSAAVHGRAYIGPHVTIGDFTFVGDGCAIHANVVLGDHVEVGTGTIIYPNVTIYPRCTIGKDVIIHAGTVIGADGFGYHLGASGLEKIPHLGTVVIDDEVEIGAHVAIDRAKTGATTIGRGTKIDNHVHIAHNVQLGAHCLLVAQVGIAGSTIIEDGVILAGQAGVQDHLRIGHGAKIAGRAGVTRDVAAGATVSGFPARSHVEQLRQEATLRRVPQLLDTIRRLEQRVQQLETAHLSAVEPEV